MTTEALGQLDRDHLFHPASDLAGLGRSGPLVWQSGKGVYITDSEGREYLEGMAGLWCTALGYGEPDSGRVLNLVYNPLGPSLPPPQAALEDDYKRLLGEEFGIRFNRLFTLTNMPIKRFGAILLGKGEFGDYMTLLKNAYRPENLEAVMCRSLLSVDYRGYLYDCDFNQMLGLPLEGRERPVHLDQLLEQEALPRSIGVADHCYGCTAGQGSSCGGALA